MLNKTKKDASSKESLAPINLISSVLIGFPFLGVVTILDIAGHKTSFASSLTLISLLLSGLALCFFWRRLTHTTNKKFMAAAYIAVQWLFMVSYTIIKVLEPAGNADHLQNMLLNASLIANIGIGMLIIGALLRTYSAKWQPQALAMTVSGIILAGILIFSTNRLTDTSHQLLTLAAKAQGVLIPKEMQAASEGFTEIIKAELPTKLASNTPADSAKTPAVANEEAKATASDKAETKPTSEATSAEKKEPKEKASAPAEATKHAAQPSKPTDEENHKHWGYEGEVGPTHWGDLNKEFSACTKGTSQSPIDIERSASAKKRFDIVYRSSPLHILDNGHTIQTPIPKNNLIFIGGKVFVLKQIHFHSPSEHTIGGAVYPLEIHLVHADEKGNIAVLGVLVEKGAANKEFAKVLSHLPDDKNVEKAIKNVGFDPQKLLPTKKLTYHYAGSLTTPPCTEGVKWYVFKDQITMSDSQIKTFREHYNNNARPVQPLDKIKLDAKN